MDGLSMIDAADGDIYVDVMERTTVYLDTRLKRRLKEAAARAGRSEAGMIREALERYLGQRESVHLEPVGRSKDGGVAARDEESLEELGFGRS